MEILKCKNLGHILSAFPFSFWFILNLERGDFGGVKRLSQAPLAMFMVNAILVLPSKYSTSFCEGKL